MNTNLLLRPPIKRILTHQSWLIKNILSLMQIHELSLFMLVHQSA